MAKFLEPLKVNVRTSMADIGKEDPEFVWPDFDKTWLSTMSILAPGIAPTVRHLRDHVIKHKGILSNYLKIVHGKDDL